jgi:hypothetical protein
LLTDGKVTGGSVATTTLYSPSHIEWCALVALRLTGASSTVAMAEDGAACESPSLVLVINDTKLLMPCVKCFELGISNTCDEGVCGNEWWPQDHKEMMHGHEMTIMMEIHMK